MEIIETNQTKFLFKKTPFNSLYGHKSIDSLCFESACVQLKLPKYFQTNPLAIRSFFPVRFIAFNSPSIHVYSYGKILGVKIKDRKDAPKIIENITFVKMQFLTQHCKIS